MVSLLKFYKRISWVYYRLLSVSRTNILDGCYPNSMTISLPFVMPPLLIIAIILYINGFGYFCLVYVD